jgi:hypothetical protein
MSDELAKGTIIHFDGWLCISKTPTHGHRFGQMRFGRKERLYFHFPYAQCSAALALAIYESVSPTIGAHGPRSMRTRVSQIIQQGCWHVSNLAAQIDLTKKKMRIKDWPLDVRGSQRHAKR